MLNRVLQSVIILSLLGIVGIIFYSGAISARQPVFLEDIAQPDGKALGFADTNLSRNFYSQLSSGRQVEFYAFSANKGDSLDIRLLVPQLAGLENYRPALALFGPGLPRPPDTDLKNLPFVVTPGFGLILSQDDPGDNQARSTVNEPYTQTGYWEGQRIGRDFPESGTYYIAVFSTANRFGKYVLQVGDRDEAGPREILSFPWYWIKLRFWFDQGYLVLLGSLVLLVLVILYYYFAVRPARLRVRLVRLQKLPPETETGQEINLKKTENSF